MTLARRRLVAQQIARHDFDRPRDLVSWFGAIQAQDYLAAKWAVGLRLSKATDAAVEQALDEGQVLRTHAMRGTWQLIAPENVRWILDLVRPRIRTAFARRHRELELDAKTLKRSDRTLTAALEEGHRTRTELAAALRKARVSPEGQRLSHLLAHAELEGLITSGARRGKQNTYALLDERAPKSRKLDRAGAIEELARRYVQSRSPATAHDFAWWSGLSISDARAGMESAASPRTAPARSRSVHLLPAFDEYLIAYQNRDDILDPNHTERVNQGGGFLSPVVVVEGRIVGTWKRTLSRRVEIQIDLFEKMKVASLEASAQRYASFLGLEASVRI